MTFSQTDSHSFIATGNQNVLSKPILSICSYSWSIFYV